MPVIHVMLWEGRDLDQKRMIAKQITDTMVNVAKVPPESVVVSFQDFAKSNWAEGGLLASDKIRLKND